MKPFELCIPTKIVFGEGRIAEVGNYAKQFGKKALLLTYDEDFVRSIGLMQKIETSMAQNNVELVPVYGVKSNPTVEHAREVIKLIKREQPDVIIALGGGSVIDEAKAVAAGVKYEGDVWELYENKPEITDAMPIIAVVTIPATSSEMNAGTVLNNDELQRKDDYFSPILCPKISILDPEITYSIPIYQTAISAVDMVSHLLEGYLSHGEEFVPMQDRYCEGMMRSIMDCMERLMKDSADKDARAMFMWTGTYAWNGFYVCGIGAFQPVIHMLGHSLSAIYDTPHGAAMAITIPAVLKYTASDRVKRYAMLARNVFEIKEKDDEKASRMGIERMEAWIRSLNVATKLSEIGIRDIELLVKNSALTAKSWGIDNMYGEAECKEMFELCR